MSDELILLVMHGMSPKDFPATEKKEYMRLRSQFDYSHLAVPTEPSIERARFDDLERKIRQWPRTPENDPFYFSAQTIAQELSRISDKPVLVGFNEFCAPDVLEVFDQAAKLNPKIIYIITPMLTSGGFHSEVEIPQQISVAQKKYPKIRFEYAWPFSASRIAEFLSGQIKIFANPQ